MKDKILVFGSGRSGTSWLAETMARPRGYRLLFEPEHDDHVSGGTVLTDRLLIPGKVYPDVDKFLLRLLRNRIDNDWIAQHSYRKYKIHLWPFLVKKIIIKFVRCNLGMHYMAHRFQVPVVYIRRDPYTTLHSQQRVKFPWLFNLDKFREQKELVDRVSEIGGKGLFEKELNPLQQLSLRWAIENLLPFHPRFQSSETINITYLDYHMMKGNIPAYRELLDKLGLQVPVDLADRLGKPSSKTHPRSIIHSDRTPDIALFTQREKAEIDSILEMFGYQPVAQPH